MLFCIYLKYCINKILKKKPRIARFLFYGGDEIVLSFHIRRDKVRDFYVHFFLNYLGKYGIMCRLQKRYFVICR